MGIILRSPNLTCFPGLTNALNRAWQNGTFLCNSNKCQNTPGRHGLVDRQGRIHICSIPLQSIQRLTAVLIHELVHATGGSELDSEAIEWAFYQPGFGATAPTNADFVKFVNASQPTGSHFRKGRWVYWNPLKGGIYGIKADGTIGDRSFRADEFIMPNPLVNP